MAPNPTDATPKDEDEAKDEDALFGPEAFDGDWDALRLRLDDTIGANAPKIIKGCIRRASQGHFAMARLIFEMSGILPQEPAAPLAHEKEDPSIVDNLLRRLDIAAAATGLIITANPRPPDLLIEGQSLSPSVDDSPAADSHDANPLADNCR